MSIKEEEVKPQQPKVYYCGIIEVAHTGPQPEAHKSIYDYRDQLAAKKKRRR